MPVPASFLLRDRESFKRILETGYTPTAKQHAQEAIESIDRILRKAGLTPPGEEPSP